MSSTAETTAPLAKVESAAPAVAEKKPATLRELLTGSEFQDAVRKALPSHLKPDRFIRVALTCITKTPKLAQCEKASFFSQLLTLSQFGLEPDGRRAHLIPFENKRKNIVECQLIIDWKGLSELIYRSGVVSTLHADVVRRGDVFKYSMGVLESHIPHFLRTDADKPAEAGEVFAVYSIATMKDGGRKAEVLSIAEAYAIRDRSSGYKAYKAGYAKSHPWVSDEAEMLKKTAFRRLSKWLPLSAEIRDAVEHYDDVVDIVATTIKPHEGQGLSALIEAAQTDETTNTEAA